MTVYVVTMANLDDTEVLGVYSTEDLAMLVANSQEHYCRVLEIRLDASTRIR